VSKFSESDGRWPLGESFLGLILGAALILSAISVSSSTFIELLKTSEAGIPPQLLFGATVLRFSLASLGMALIALGMMPVWQSNGGPDDFALFDRGIDKIVLGGILLVAVGLRLYGLDQGLWYDEILTYVHYARLSFGEIITTYDDQNQHFLYSVLAHASFLSFGESGWSLRLPAVLFGAGSIWALYVLGREVANSREALLSASLLTFSYHHIWFSQNARGYIGLLFWTILSSWLLLRAMRETRPRLWLLYAVAVALGVYTHVTMIFVVTGHFIIYLITLSNRRNEIWPHRWSGFFLGFFLAGLLTLVLFALVLPQLFGGTLWQGAEKSAAVTVWKNPLWTVSEIIRVLPVDSWRGILALLAFAIFVAGLWNYIRTRPVVIGLLIIPTFIGAATTLWMGHPLWPRLFFFSSGLIALVVVRGVMQLARATTLVLNLAPTKSTPIGTALCVGLFLISAVSAIKAYAPKQDYVGALSYIQENHHPGDEIVTVGVMVTVPYKNLYKTDWKPVDSVEELKSIRSGSKRIWLLYTMPVYLEQAYPEIMTAIRNDFRVVKEFHGTLGGGTIFVCRSDLSTATTH
jgi:hypothetical protein